MTKILTLKAGAAVAMAEFNVNPTPPLATYKLEAPPPATTNCNPQKCPWWPYSSSKDFKANTALIVIVLICALIIALAFNAAIRYIIRLHCSRRRDEEAGEGKAETGAAEAEVAAKIPWLIYSEEMEVGAECTICLSEFVVGERIRVLEKCGHGFHLQCIQKWLASHSSCPTCRANCDAMANQPGTVSVPT